MVKLYVGYRLGFWTGTLHQLVSRYSSEFIPCPNPDCPTDAHYWMFFKEPGFYEVQAQRTDLTRDDGGSSVSNVLFRVKGPSADGVREIIRGLGDRMNMGLRRPSAALEERLLAQDALKPNPQANQS